MITPPAILTTQGLFRNDVPVLAVAAGALCLVAVVLASLLKAPEVPSEN